MIWPRYARVDRITGAAWVRWRENLRVMHAASLDIRHATTSLMGALALLLPLALSVAEPGPAMGQDGGDCLTANPPAVSEPARRIGPVPVKRVEPK